jgi:hypothetical protein
MNERDRRRRTSELRRDGRGLPTEQASQGRADPRGAGSARVPEAEVRRFWAKVDRDDSGCWLWTGATTANGYGRFRVRRDSRWTHVMAHRWAYEAANGPIPDGIYPDHLCHTNDADCPGGTSCPHRRCVNPDHLDAVGDEENRRRARARARKKAT